jgi:hypothetical protein
VSFKGVKGVLSCDSLGVLGARREVRGMEEAFVVEAIIDDGEGGDSGKGKVR